MTSGCCGASLTTCMLERGRSLLVFLHLNIWTSIPNFDCIIYHSQSHFHIYSPLIFTHLLYSLTSYMIISRSIHFPFKNIYLTTLCDSHTTDIYYIRPIARYTSRPHSDATCDVGTYPVQDPINHCILNFPVRKPTGNIFLGYLGNHRVNLQYIRSVSFSSTVLI